MYVSFSPSSSHLQHKYFFNFQIPSAESYFFIPPKFFSKLNQNYQSLLTVKKKKKNSKIIIKEPWYIYLLLKHMKDVIWKRSQGTQ